MPFFPVRLTLAITWPQGFRATKKIHLEADQVDGIVRQQAHSNSHTLVKVPLVCTSPDFVITKPLCIQTSFLLWPSDVK